MGVGDVYVYRAFESAYQSNTFYRATAAIAYGLNTWVFVLAAFFCVTILWKFRTVDRSVLVITIILLYVTGIYWVFQSEPRYSIPFRSLQIFAAVLALKFVSGWVRTRLPVKEPARFRRT